MSTLTTLHRSLSLSPLWFRFSFPELVEAWQRHFAVIDARWQLSQAQQQGQQQAQQQAQQPPNAHGNANGNAGVQQVLPTSQQQLGGNASATGTGALTGLLWVRPRSAAANAANAAGANSNSNSHSNAGSSAASATGARASNGAAATGTANSNGNGNSGPHGPFYRCASFCMT